MLFSEFVPYYRNLFEFSHCFLIPLAFHFARVIEFFSLRAIIKILTRDSKGMTCRSLGVSKTLSGGSSKSNYFIIILVLFAF